ncbi:uncharacterized protein LOC123548939 [Mercenaria mercenaria]|uniref:uncharacterized protein LOC123548939 n=1 Tax=Mercenaria mercenaria TaxID=6596 RepID=UPI00234FAADC|nr:uncharacterized protein LOC123548939 [Mercenaria mercenaria]
MQSCHGINREQVIATEQMIQDAKEDIDTKERKAYTAIDDKTQRALDNARKELDNHCDSRLKTMKKMIELLNERITQNELDTKELKTDNVVIKQRLTEIEQHVDRLDDARNMHQKQLEYAEQKQELQRKMVKQYQNHYVKTWISPFKVQNNNVDIKDVYVSPNIEDENGEPRVIKRYRDIFQTNERRHKRIYIVGDVGTGKSSFSKMMIYSWCSALNEDENNTVQSDNAEELKRFHFLFFVPLQRMSEFSCDLTDMIKELYKHVVSEKLINKIFTQEGERCLIIIDSLDEWTPPKSYCLPLHVTHGIPLGDGIEHATFLTFSRPSAKGILNMKKTEYHKKIKLIGIAAGSVHEFIRKYMTQLHQNKASKNINYFVDEIKKSALQHLEETPLFLQQLICLFCKENTIGKSVSDIYSNILNIILCWFKKGKEDEDMTEDIIYMREEFIHISLPELLKRFPRCKANKRFIFLVGKIAYKTLTNETNSSTFSRSKLRELGLTKSDITSLIEMGIIVEHTCLNQEYEETCLCFIHLSYLEFFAAVYISSNYHSMHSPTSKQKHRLESTVILEDLFRKFKSASDILQLSNILKMVCGLSPFMLSEISKFISNKVEVDESMIRYRHNLQLDEIDRTVVQIQRLLNNCLSESGNHETATISLYDIVVHFRADMNFFRKILPITVNSLYLSRDTTFLTGCSDIFEWITQLPSLQFASINVTKWSSLKHAFSFTQAVSLRHLTFKSDYDYGYIVDLSTNSQLKSVHLENVQCILGSESNVKNLEFFYDWIFDRFEVLSHAVSIKQMTLKCDSRTSLHTIDISKLYRIKSIHLEGCLLALQSRSPVESIYISLKNKNTSESKVHEKYEQLCSSLSRCVSVKCLTLKGIDCHDTDCEGHTIDLSELNMLQEINLSCPFTIKSDIKTESLESIFISCKHGVKLSHERCQQLSSSLPRFVSLKKCHWKVSNVMMLIVRVTQLTCLN